MIIYSSDLVEKILSTCNSSQEFLERLKEACLAHGLEYDILMSEALFKSRHVSNNATIVEAFKSCDFHKDPAFMKGIFDLYNKKMSLFELDEMVRKAKIFYFCKTRNLKLDEELMTVLKECAGGNGMVTNSKCPFASAKVDTINDTPYSSCLVQAKLGNNASLMTTTKLLKEYSGQSFSTAMIIIDNDDFDDWRIQASIMIVMLTRGSLMKSSAKILYNLKMNGNVTIYCTDGASLPTNSDYFEDPVIRLLDGHFDMNPADLVFTGICSGMISKSTLSTLWRVSPFLLWAGDFNTITKYISDNREYPGPERITMIREEFASNIQNSSKPNSNL